jgi:hypothetical protein
MALDALPWGAIGSHGLLVRRRELSTLGWRYGGARFESAKTELLPSRSAAIPDGDTSQMGAISEQQF